MSHLVLLLPGDPLTADAASPWWRIHEGSVTLKGRDDGWRAHLDEEVILTLIAPPGPVRLQLAEGLDTPQARTAARLALVDKAIGVEENLHAAVGERALPDGRHALALVERRHMDAWLDWATRMGVEPRQIVPAAILPPADGKWHEARLAHLTYVTRDGLAVDEEPALMQALVGDDFVDTLDADTLETRLVAEAMEPSIDLRQGDYAWRKPWRVDLARLKEFAVLAGLILLAALLIQIVQIVRLDAAEARLDEETAALASNALGRPVTALEAETALAAQRPANLRGGDAIASLVAQIDSAGLVTAENIAWDANGMLSATLAAPDANAANAVLIELQRGGWVVTATNRPGDDGRQLVDITMRGNR